ncbi:MAG: trypsin-like peptidase domain-containing protein [Oscillospiraceae bacterium]|nr:trypsin-like peptidase domain-containing protein [Oscillospiraceae bacterium]
MADFNGGWDYNRRNNNDFGGAHERREKNPYNWDYDNFSRQDRPSSSARMKGLVVFASMMCVILVAGVLALSGFGVYSLVSKNSESTAAAEQSQIMEQANDVQVPSINAKPKTAADNIVSADGKLTPQQIAKKTLPTVVGVVNYKAGNTLMAGSKGEASGIIITSDGYIVTNAHVVKGAVGLKIVTNSGDEYAAALVGADDRSDLAVLKIEAEDLPYAELGDSSELEIGEPVLAVGNPGGLVLAGSVTDGIVSALNRPIPTDGADTINCIQTNAAINPGNSGGALVNQYGQVVGINSSKIAYEGYEGLGFAIAINEAQPIIEDLMKYGMVTGRVKIGVSIIEVDQYLSRLNNLPTGIYVQSVDRDSDAMAQGVVPGDVITHVNGTRVEKLKEVREIIDEFEAGDEITLTIYRATTGYQPKELEITIKLMEDVPSLQNNLRTE